MALYGGIKLPGQPDYENIRKLDQMPVRCVMEMMHRGFAIDKEYLRDISDYLGSCMSEMRKDICSYIPPDKLDEFIGKDDDEMNVDSNQQLGDLLFDILKIGDGRELKRTKSGDRLSTGKKQLEVLKREHPIIQKILIYREHAKLKSTYADSLPNKSVWHPQGLCWCGERHIAGTWRIHTTILGTRTSTGRYASKNPNCFSGDTEVLTEDGWVRLDEYHGGKVAQWEDGIISFVDGEYIISNKPCGVHISNKHIDIMSTVDHRCLLQHRKTGGFKVFRADDYPNDWKQLNAGIHGFSRGSTWSDMELRLLMALQADGSFNYAGGRWKGSVTFIFGKKRKSDRLKWILKYLPIKYTYVESNGRYKFYLNVQSGLNKYHDLLGRDKIFDWRFFFGLSRRQVQIVLDEVMIWDGCITRMNHYSSKHKINADIISTLYSLSGIRAVVRKYVNSGGSVNWQVDITKRDYTFTSNRKLEFITANGKTYCISVPSTFILVRRNGKTMVTGNCQNISARTELGRLIRAAFIATPGMVLVGCDWSQQEMRFGGHYSQDRNLLRIFREGLDPHTDTAKRAFKKTEYEVTNKEGKFLYRDPCKCFHPDTEVLTKNGWCKIVNLGIEEEVAQAIPGKDMSVGLSWVKPTYVGSKDNHYDHMLHLRSEGIDLIVTPDHRMLGWLDSGRYVVDIPDSMLRRCRYWANAGIMEGGIGVDLNILKIAVAVQADGNVTKDGLIRLGFTKQRKKERILRLLDGSGLSYYKAEYRNGTLSILIHKKSAKVVLGLLDADKTLPWNWLGLSAEARGVVLEEAEFWDSWSGPKSYRYTSAHKKNVDVLQAIAAITGRKTRVVEDSSNSRKNNSHSILYNLTVRSNCISRTGNVAVEKVAYAGKVACLSVPSSFVLVRYGGVVTVCGQSVNFGVFYGLAAPGLYDLMAITYATAGIPLPDWLTVSWCEDFINQWFELYPGVREYLNEQEYRAFRYGMVWTLFGRVREVPEAKSCHKRIVTAGIRQAGNLPIQGTCADLMRLVLPEVHDFILGQLRTVGINVWPLITVHDEGIWEVEEDYADMFKDYLEYTFGNVMVDKDTGVNLCRVAIKAESKIIERWQK
jgi:DNA polymerase I-like protein with 3'-5' exonuclease and polymerase domains